MNVNEYLQKVLSRQILKEDSTELTELQIHRTEVEALIRKTLGSLPTIRYGGSKAKGTLIRESYDLDVVCYIPCDSDAAGKTLEEIYFNVRDCLANQYYVEEKTSALRLRGKTGENFRRDFHIDVVPGRFTDEANADCYIYQKSADKCRLKTNLDVHIQHIRDSEVLEAIRLLKLWNARNLVGLKQFVFELLIIKVLAGMKSKPHADQLTHVWGEIVASADAIGVEDPANPCGNDLSAVVKDAWPKLTITAKSTLETIRLVGWESIFGPVEVASATVVDRGSARRGIRQRTQQAMVQQGMKRPWYERAPALWAKVKEDLTTAYPDLHGMVEQGTAVIRGSFPVRDGADILNRFLIEIQLPPDFPDSVPILREIGGRLPWASDRHINPGSGEACPIVPEEWLIHANHDSILAFLDGPVRNFFIGQILVELGQPWPFGERAHGIPGLIEAYGEIIGVSDEPTVLRYLDCLARETLKGHWDCPCGSGTRLRNCHIEAVKVLRQRIPLRVARQALNRIAELSRLQQESTQPR